MATDTSSRPLSLRRDAPAAVPAARRPGRLRGDRAPVASELRWLSPLAVILLWQLASTTGVLPVEKLAAPSQILEKAWDLTTAGTLSAALWASLKRALLGFVVGAVIAVAAGIWVGLSRVGDAVLDPVMQMVRTIPLFGLIPLFIVWFGIGELSKVLLVALGVAVPLYLNLVAGLRGVDPDLYDVADSVRLTRRERITQVLLPGAMPGFLTGLRQSLGFAWLALIVAEQVNAGSGIGFLINNAREFNETDTIVVGLMAYAVLGLLTDAIVRALERRALRWRGDQGASA